MMASVKEGEGRVGERTDKIDLDDHEEGNKTKTKNQKFKKSLVETTNMVNYMPVNIRMYQPKPGFFGKNPTPVVAERRSLDLFGVTPCWECIPVKS